MPGTNTVSKKKRTSSKGRADSVAPQASAQEEEQVSTEKKKKLLFVGAEVMPFAATGGLGDVLGSLPEALASFDPSLDVRVVMPLYSAVGEKYRSQMKTEAVFTVALAWRRQYCGVLSLEKNGVKYYFIDNEYYFRRDGLYGQYDDGERYAFFCTAVMDMMPVLEYFPDILHAHDWQAALTVIYLHQKYRRDERWSRMRSVFTIHNIEYQGKYDVFILGDVFGLSEFDRSVVECDGVINLMKGAVECADRVSTVSPRYAEEILSPEYAHGLDGVLRRNSGKLIGILNGIDYSYYDPEADPVLAENYCAENISGKYVCRSSLRRDLSLPDDADRPLIAVISRLASHKGVDLVREALRGILRSTGAQFVVLGMGESKYIDLFSWAQWRYAGQVSACFQMNNPLAHKIYGACDMFLMPSMFEPCGLSQLIALRYGTLPITRETGGLRDTVLAYNEYTGDGNGFTFLNYNAHDMLHVIENAVEMYKNKRIIFNGLAVRAMNGHYGWDRSAKTYLELYNKLCEA